MAHIETASRHVALNQEYVADASAPGGVVIFDNVAAGSWLPLYRYDRVLAYIIFCTGASNLTAMTIRGATDAAGTGAATIATLSNPTNITDPDDTAMIEATSTQLERAYYGLTGNDLSHINIGVATDQASPIVGTLLRYNSRYHMVGLTTATESQWT